MLKNKTYKVVGPVVSDVCGAGTRTVCGVWDEDGKGWIFSHTYRQRVSAEEFKRLHTSPHNGSKCMAFPATRTTGEPPSMNDVDNWSEGAVNYEDDFEKAFELIVKDLGIEVERDA